MKLLINLDVPDLEHAVAFYRDALGLKLARILDQDTAEMLGADSTLYLQCNPAGSWPVPDQVFTRDYARHWTPVHIDFVVDDLEQAVQRALAAGAKQEGDARAWHGARWITLCDPFGNGFCLLEFENGSETYGAD